MGQTRSVLRKDTSCLTAKVNGSDLRPGQPDLLRRLALKLLEVLHKAIGQLPVAGCVLVLARPRTRGVEHARRHALARLGNLEAEDRVGLCQGTLC